MNKYLNRILLVLLVLFALGFGCYCLISAARTDSTVPEISFTADTVSVSVGDDPTALLAGVSAFDREDGDVSASVLVEGISSIRKDHCATVTYAAFDSAGNVAKAQRTVSYTDYQSPRFSLDGSLMFRSGLSFDLFDYVSATDPVDGDLSSKIKASLVGGDTSISQLGLHEVELRVTNSMGDIARLTVPVEVYPAGEFNASVTLSQYLVYLKQGTAFLPRQYIQAFDTGYHETPLAQLEADNAEIEILSDVKTDVCGTYTVTYTITHRNYTGCGRLVVVVEE